MVLGKSGLAGMVYPGCLGESSHEGWEHASFLAAAAFLTEKTVHPLTHPTCLPLLPAYPVHMGPAVPSSLWSGVK